MGAEPWYYFVPYQRDINKAMLELRQREFEAGRYNPVQPFLSFLPDLNTAAPGAQYASIEEALQAAGADGTRSILDMERVATDPDDTDCGVITPVSEECLLDHFGTARPTRQMIEDSPEVMESVERGQEVYIIAYRDDKPAEIFFAGYSYD